MSKCKLFFLVSFIYISCFSKGICGATVAPDFTLKDVTGIQHNLYNYLNSGKSVILNFSSTWCKPCWNYEQSGVLDKVWETFGPSGTDDVVVIFIEADGSTCDDCLFGQENCNDFTYGNWTEKAYPTVSLNKKSLHLNSSFEIDRFPSIVGISAKDFSINTLGQLSFTNWNSWITRQSDKFHFSFLNRVEAEKVKAKFVSKNISNSYKADKKLVDTQLSVFPNPCAEALNIDVSGSYLSSLIIFDNKGRKVEGIPYNLSPGKNHIDITTLKSGIYFAKVNNGNFEKIKKFIVLK